MLQKTDHGPDVGGSADDNSTRKNDTLPRRDASESILFTLVNISYFYGHLSKHLTFNDIIFTVRINSELAFLSAGSD